ncbi:MAG: CoxG family protein [Betaproteobacteria bacterium]
MQVKLEKRYPLDVPPQAAWALLTDLPELARCMPGAELGEALGENRYKGLLKMKVGPATAAFAGEIEVLQVDAAARSVTLRGKGSDRGGSSAALDLTATVHDGDAGGTLLLGQSEVTINGKFAQFGGRMIGQVSDLVIGQFVQNFAAKAAARAAAAAPAAVTAPPGVESTAPAPAAAAPQASAELSALGILWALIKGFFARLFGRGH